MKLGVRVGVQYPSSAESLVSQLVSAFVTKVEGDGGSVENQSCLTTDLEFLTQNP